MTAELETKLEAIVGKTFNYKGSNITIEKYKYVNNSNVVVFTPKPINLLVSEVEGFLSELYDPIYKEKSEAAVYVPKNVLISFEPTKENTAMKQTLLDTLQKVKDDPNYIPQATAICNVVDKMAQIQKNEIQMLQVINKLKN